MKRNYNLHLIPGVSASGKTIIARSIQEAHRDVEIVVGYTTRKKRPAEVDGVDYHFKDIAHYKSHAKMSGWSSSQFGDSYYYGPDSGVVPDEVHPRKILPVSFSTLLEVMKDYSPLIDKGAITVAPIVINENNYDGWMENAIKCRPGRDLDKELLMQDKIINEVNMDGIFIHTWELHEDIIEYQSLYNKITSKGNDNCENRISNQQ